ncbi:hypothetical protein [Candidatus Symbiopectobacterium sp.]|uniref:hypothetical protein n=1 Tax=Candidatus Symbiopectobacterium sp. TaxID=2816440 RepID=UPI0025BABB11|nr:hypothetical protein [Candidatus Symbiopectobacterium sp.]
MRGSVVSLGCQHKIYLFNKAIRCLFTKRASYINFSHCIPHPKPDISHCNQHIEYTTKKSQRLWRGLFVITDLRLKRAIATDVPDCTMIKLCGGGIETFRE